MTRHETLSLDKGSTSSHLCQWPTCDKFAICEIGIGIQEKHYVCKKHREEWMNRSVRLLSKIDWQPRRYQNVRRYMEN